MLHYTSLLIGFFVGALVVIQGGLNARLMAAIGSSIPTSLINFSVGTLTLLAFTVVSGQLSNVPLWTNAPRWSLLGGCVGALLVMGTAFIIPRIGTAHAVALIVCGQAITSLLFDHFGLLGVPQITISLSRILGCTLLVIGALILGR